MNERNRRAQIAKQRALAIQPQPTTRDETRAGIMTSLKISERDAEILLHCIEVGDHLSAQALTNLYLMRDTFMEE